VGSVYARKGTWKLWIKYLPHGRVIRESTGTDNIVKARRFFAIEKAMTLTAFPSTPTSAKSPSTRPRPIC
jgi:hypothetical protein